jgi:regulator of RNase E activity RraA
MDEDGIVVVTCPVCGKDIDVVMEWQDAEYDVGIHEGWVAGISADSTCIAHLTDEQWNEVEEKAQEKYRNEPSPHERAADDEATWALVNAEAADYRASERAQAALDANELPLNFDIPF